jgi:prolyl 4-hydroxylase
LGGVLVARDEHTEQNGGQRVFSGLVYLNEPGTDFQGGDTVFPALNISFTPKAGMMLFWRNVDQNMAPDPRTRHYGAVVESGHKLALNIWLLERPFELYRTSLR